MKTLNLTLLLPETLSAMKELKVGKTRTDKWELDSITEGGYTIIEKKKWPSINWAGPEPSEAQKAEGMNIFKRKTKNGDYMVIRTPNTPPNVLGV